MMQYQINKDYTRVTQMWFGLDDGPFECGQLVSNGANSSYLVGFEPMFF